MPASKLRRKINGNWRGTKRRRTVRSSVCAVRFQFTAAFYDEYRVIKINK